MFRNYKKEILSNKAFDGGFAAPNKYMELPKGTTAELEAIPRREGALAYDTTLDKVVIDDGSGFAEVGSAAAAATWEKVTVSFQDWLDEEDDALVIAVIPQASYVEHIFIKATELFTSSNVLVEGIEILTGTPTSSQKFIGNLEVIATISERTGTGAASPMDESLDLVLTLRLLDGDSEPVDFSTVTAGEVEVWYRVTDLIEA